MNDFIFGGIIGVLIGIGMTVALHGTIKQASEQKTLCEETLPRNQVCEMKFVPKED